MSRSFRRFAPPPVAGPELESQIESLDLEGRGIARIDGKVAFIEGALPGERVRWQRMRGKARYDTGRTVEVLQASAQRAQPGCVHFGFVPGSCGGCSMQHLEARAQVAAKQRVLEDTLWHIGQVRAGQILRPVAGSPWAYRHRARLTSRHVPGKGGALVGFHERASSYVADMHSCAILAEPVGRLIEPLRALVDQLSIRARMPQIEVAITGPATVLVFRVLEPPSQTDRDVLEAFGRHHGVRIWLQPEGPDSAAPLVPQDEPPLRLPLPEFEVALDFRPTDFTQVNHRINEILVRRALALLAPQAGERVADLFCGMGNFTLPLARRASFVLGVEGSAALTRRAQAAAQSHGLAGRTAFEERNLFEFSAADWDALCERHGRFDRVLIDPPRDGAFAVVQALAGGRHMPHRVVYVSCSPATLARDCGWLVHQAGWRVQAAGVVNMFPHTAHVESMAVLVPPATGP
jgi:23S rRNA (uracil1939-C5)-methyltransferase